MKTSAKAGAVRGSQTRRGFLKGAGATGAALLYPQAWSGLLSGPARESAARAGKKINLLNAGDFQGSCWGWQFTSGASVMDAPGRSGRRAVGVKSTSGDYARFLVLGPEQGKTYTLSGWVKTENVVQQEENAGTYFAASQYEFQGRPTEFTVDGKQMPEQRYGNFTGSADWQHFSRSFRCLETTTWFEVIIGNYRASGSAWFSDLTFVEGDQPASIEDVVDHWQAEQWAHEALLQRSRGLRPSAAILRDNFPVRGTASDPVVLAKVLSETHHVEFVDTDAMGDAQRFNRDRFDLLVLPYGESFPLVAWGTVQKFLADGGDLLTTGGYAFQSPVVKKAGRWEFYDEEVAQESGPNLLPEVNSGGWKASNPSRARAIVSESPGITGPHNAVEIGIPLNLWEQNESWTFDLSASGDGEQFYFECWMRTDKVKAAPDGCAYVGVEQLDADGYPAYAARMSFVETRGSSDWQKVSRLFYLVPTCRKLRVRIGLKNATGTVRGAGFRLDRRSPQIRINTAHGFPEDSLNISPKQIGMFDPDFRLRRAEALRPAKGQSILPADTGVLTGKFEGYAASAVVGMNNARWKPLLQAEDQLGRKRGAAGALVHNARGTYARGSWAFFGVENEDIFAADSKPGQQILRAIGRDFARKCFLHACDTNYATYRKGEEVTLRVLASNYGRQEQPLKLRWQVFPVGDGKSVFDRTEPIHLTPGQTSTVEARWNPASWTSDRYRVRATLFAGQAEIDQIETGFNIWNSRTLQEGLAFEFRDNYFQVDGKNLFLQGTDDYLHTFIDQDENPLTWYEDAQGCRDSCIDVYENLMGLRGPQQRPTETWWRWIDAMLLNVQRAGGAFFPGMLIFSNTAVSNQDMADQQAYVRAFAERYRDAAGIMYYLNGDLELHDPNLPDLQKFYNAYLKEKYGSDEALRSAWKISPPEGPIGTLTIRRGTEDWADVRTADDFRFRTQVVRRWLNAMHDAIREADARHPVTAEFYQRPVSGIDLLLALDKLELANFGYFNEKDEDFYRFPQTCKFLDQSMRGKGINVGEFGVKTHPAWNDTGYYIEARTEAYEHAYFLAIAHYGFALGASKIQNWCWKYPADLPFEWGINYPNDMVPRDVRAFYRNTGLLFRRLRPRYESSETLVLLAGDNRMGGGGSTIVEGQFNCIRLLLDQRLRFSTLADDYLESLPDSVKTIFYPLPYCPSDAIVARLQQFVDKGGQLYISGDLSYDSLRQRTHTQRLKDLCGVEFVSERFANIAYQHGALRTIPEDDEWPAYIAAPGIITRLAGARVLLKGENGIPVVTEFRRGAGRVIFCADPIELHGDPRYQGYAHQFYSALLKSLRLKGEALEPGDAPVHCFHVPSQDTRDIKVLVNYDSNNSARDISVPSADSYVRVTLAPRMSGIAVSAPGRGLQVVESSADAFEGSRLVIGSDLHVMAIAIGDGSLLDAHALLLLPMGQGELRIPNASRWERPIAVLGEIAGSQWREYESLPLVASDGLLKIPIHAGRSLSMLILCEAAERPEAIKQVEAWHKTPWR